MRKILVPVLCLLMGFFAFANTTSETYMVKPGDTLSSVLSVSFAPDEIMSLSRDLKALEPSFVLKAGMSMEILPDEYALQIAQNKEARFYRQDTLPMVTVIEHEAEILPTVVRGTIQSNLFTAVKEIGEGADLAAQLARMYEWEFDFFRDIHPGDTFSVLVEKKFINGRYTGYGRVLAANFTVKGKEHKAFYYHNGKSAGYYDSLGSALERGFLRVPLSYSRITSRFTDNRLHPVLGVNRPHYGVDYAAPIGTPVMATASGTVVAKSYSKSNGNYVHLRHPNGYETYYLHLNGFNQYISVGVQVNQGQVIGYVGKTGYATGPHLDYRIKHHGKWINPVDFIAESPKLTAEHIEIFKENAYAYEQVLIHSVMYTGIYKKQLIP